MAIDLKGLPPDQEKAIMELATALQVYSDAETQWDATNAEITRLSTVREQNRLDLEEAAAKKAAAVTNVQIALSPKS